jgi:hypothetical protein
MQNKRYIVTNIAKTTQVLYDHQGQALFIAPGKSALLQNPPNCPDFKVMPVLDEVEEKIKLEKKNEETKLNTKEVTKNGTRPME